MNKQIFEDEIRTKKCSFCSICGSEGNSLYYGLKDVIFEAPGMWGFRICTNDLCRLIWLDPMPLEDEIGKAYSTYYTHIGYRKTVEKNNVSQLRKLYNTMKVGYLSYRYGYEPADSPCVRALGRLISLVPSRRVALDFSVFFLSANPGGRLLEVGCGSGETLRLLLKLGWQAEGVDFDPHAVHNARDKGLSVSLGSLEQQYYSDNHFDAVVMSHLIEHVYDPLRLLQESRRILKPGGHIVIITPNSDSFGHKWFQQYWRGLEPPRHLHIFSCMSLGILAKKAGFKHLKLSSTIRNADNIFILSEMYRTSNDVIEGRPETIRRRAWAKSMQYIEWLLLLFRCDVGEEIALIAKK